MKMSEPLFFQEFEAFIEERKRRGASEDEYANWRFLLNLAKTGKCKVCGEAGYTIFKNGADEDGSITLIFKCNKCFTKWLRDKN